MLPEPELPACDKCGGVRQLCEIYGCPGGIADNATAQQSKAIEVAASDAEAALDVASEIVSRRYGRRWESDAIADAELRVAAMICARMATPRMEQR